MSKNNREPEPQSNNFNKVCHGTEIIGTINAATDFRIDGYVDGNINCKGKIVVGEKAHIKGDIISRNVDVNGRVEGTLTVSELLCLTKSAIVTGNILAKKLAVEVGAEFSGTCQMSDHVSETPIFSSPQE